MRLSELKTGQKGVIVKVLGHGGFRKRIVEMGFIRGKTVEVLLNAPLQDPVKYRILGYEVSLRHDEAELIEVVGDVKEGLPSSDNTVVEREVVEEHLDDSSMAEEAHRKRHIINVAIVGNPNCGKTSLFNFASGAHAKVGNYSGVTVDATEAKASFEGYEFNLIDLPGTYSLSAYSPEELYVRKYIIDQTPDIVINVIDSSNLERNLYLTTQLIDMNLRMVCALNMYDEFEKRGDHLDIDKLSQLLGTPMVPTSFKTGKGLKLLFHVIINMYEGVDFLDKDGNINPEVAEHIKQWHENYADDVEEEHQEDFAAMGKPGKNYFRHIHINHGQYVEQGIDTVKMEIQRDTQLRHRFSTRYLAIKLIEHDAEVEKMFAATDKGRHIIKTRDLAEEKILADTGQDSETALMDAKYGFIRGALTEAGYKEGDANANYRVTHLIDGVLSNKYLGFPIFFLILFVMFYTTFSLGEYPMNWIDEGVSLLGEWVSRVMPDGPLKDLIVDGVIAGVGSVIVFLPQILILYFFISLMEDSGYMARAAFIMDRLMHKMGLHGKSFIPLIMGFGCNVPAVMATRTIESRRSRIITMMILPFMSCTARIPIYIMITGTFFALQYRAFVMVSLYAVGILVAVVVSNVISRLVIKGEDTPFVMELPPYRMPTSKAIARHTWEKGKEYLKKMAGIILVASVIVWALGYFPHNDQLTKQEQQEQSLIGQMGKAVAPVFEPQGFSWKLDVSLIAGLGAKEIVASTIGVLYSGDESFAEDNSYNDEGGRYDTMHKLMAADGINPLTAYCYLLFVLLYFPCLATIVAIKNETGGWKWALCAAGYTTAVAWCISAVVYQIGSLF